MKRDRAPTKPITYKNVLFFLGLFALFGCPCSIANLESEPAHRPYISMTINPLTFATGEQRTIQVKVETAPGERAGQTVTVTPLTPDGWQVTPSSREVTLSQSGFVETSFQLQAPTTGGSSHSLAVRRTHHTNIVPERFVHSVQVEVHANLVSIEAIPSTTSVPRGGSQTFTLNVLPRGNTAGNLTLTLGSHPSFTFTPSQFNVALTAGSTVPVSQVITVNAAANAPGAMRLVNVYTTGDVVTGSFAIETYAGSNPSFTFTATPLQVTSATYEESPAVTFTLTSQNGFSGDVVVDPEADGEVGIIPTVSAETFTVVPGTPTTFTRRFQRYYGTNDIHVTFTATHAATSTSRQVVITSKHP